MVGDDPFVGAGDVDDVVVPGAVQLVRRILLDQGAGLAPRAVQGVAHRVLDAVLGVAGVVLRPARVVDAVALVDPERLAEVARHPAERLLLVEREAVVAERRDPCTLVAPQEVARAIILHIHAGIDRVAIEGALAHDRLGFGHERAVRRIGYGRADLGAGHEVEHIPAVGAAHDRRSPRAIGAVPPRHVAQIERRITLPRRQIVGDVHAERGGAPLIHAIVGAVQEVVPVEDREVGIGAIAVQRIGGERRVVDAVRQLLARHGAHDRFGKNSSHIACNFRMVFPCRWVGGRRALPPARGHCGIGAGGRARPAGAGRVSP